MVVASMVNGFLMPRYGLIPFWYIGGSTLALIGTALMCKTISLKLATTQANRLSFFFSQTLSMITHPTPKSTATTSLWELAQDATLWQALPLCSL